MDRGQQQDAHRPQCALESGVSTVYGFIPSLKMSVNAHRIQMDPGKPLGLSNLDLFVLKAQ